MDAKLLWTGIMLAIAVGPIALALRGLFFARRGIVASVSTGDPDAPQHLAHAGEGTRPHTPPAAGADATPSLPLILNSAVVYALSYNLIFFIQELFLVVPKALTSGLRPTLFHNNHTWSGDNPVAALLQGTPVRSPSSSAASRPLCSCARFGPARRFSGCF